MINTTPAPTTTTYGLGHRQTFGLRWERWAADQLTALGWAVTTPADFNARYDLKIGKPGYAPTLHVEIKTARQTWRRVRSGYYRPRYQFDLTGGLDPARTDFLYILIALSDSTGEITPFIAPSYALGGRRHIALTSEPHKYNGKLLAGYRHNWDIVNEVYVIRRRFQMTAAGQLSLFEVLQ